MNIETIQVPAPERGEEKRLEEMTLEELSAEIKRLEAEIERLEDLSAGAGENIDVEPGSDPYVDLGFKAEARELEARLEEACNMRIVRENEVALDTIADAAQRKLDI